MMVFKNRKIAVGAIALLLSPALFGFSSVPPRNSASSRIEQQLALRFPSAPRGSTGPARTATGGSRSTCFVDGGEGIVPMTVLMPMDNLGTTTAADPNLFLYIPKTNINGGEVNIFDVAAKREIYLKQFDLSQKPGNTPGIVKLSLSGANLEPNKLYEWSFTPFCNSSEGQPEYTQTVVQGHFQRTGLSPAQNARLQRASTPLERAEIYAGANIWNETIALVREIGNTAPQEWLALLSSVELEDVAKAPYFGEAPILPEEAAAAAEIGSPTPQPERLLPQPQPQQVNPDRTVNPIQRRFEGF